jgi:hypothetical protein
MHPVVFSFIAFLSYIAPTYGVPTTTSLPSSSSSGSLNRRDANWFVNFCYNGCDNNQCIGGPGATIGDSAPNPCQNVGNIPDFTNVVLENFYREGTDWAIRIYEQPDCMGNSDLLRGDDPPSPACYPLDYKYLKQKGLQHFKSFAVDTEAILNDGPNIFQ